MNGRSLAAFRHPVVIVVQIKKGYVLGNRPAKQVIFLANDSKLLAIIANAIMM